MTRRCFLPISILAAQAVPQARDLYFERTQKRRLGLRYTLFREQTGHWQEVPRGKVLQTGDRIRMLFECNTRGKLFLLARAANGNWEPAAPNLPLDIAPNRPYTLPPSGEWILDPPAGAEILCVIFGRQGEDGLKQLVNEAGKNGGAALMAAAQGGSRDLIVDVEPAAQVGGAHYLVNLSGEPNATIIREVRIHHEARRPIP